MCVCVRDVFVLGVTSDWAVWPLRMTWKEMERNERDQFKTNERTH